MESFCNTIMPTIVDKTVEKIAYLGGIFLDFVADRFFPSPLPPGSSVVGSSKESRISKHLAFVGSNFELGEGVFFTQSR